MRLKKISIKNFRGYKDKIEIEFTNLTAFVGKNDIGKSTVLEALDIFFNENNGIVKIDKDDINNEGLIAGDNEIIISAIFDEYPNELIIDSTNSTSLENEYLLNSFSELEIIKKYHNAGKEKVFVKAFHPTFSECEDLLLKKDTELRKIITDKNIECSDRTRNSIMRSSIWNHFSDSLELAEIEIEINKGDTKGIWQKLKSYLPIYTLFQSDRKNSDGDSEVQDPLQEAVKQILKNESIQSMLSEVANVVEEKLKEVSERTLTKLVEMSPEIASTLNPVIPTADNLKWSDVFKKVSISGDGDIPINKRGSGVKRLVLLNFFRAEAERKLSEEDSNSIIYAIEEPETSQHTNNQIKLVEALKILSVSPNTQVILTTHSSNIVKKLSFNNLRLISEPDGIKSIDNISPQSLPYPSLNEVNYLAFKEISEEYHNELYGFIDAEGKLNDFRIGKSTIPYTKQLRNGTREEQYILTEYVRHQIHHPENTINPRFSHEQLTESIGLMRNFLFNTFAEV